MFSCFKESAVCCHFLVYLHCLLPSRASQDLVSLGLMNINDVPLCQKMSATVVCAYVVSPPTSSPSERLSSVGGTVISENCSTRLIMHPD